MWSDRKEPVRTGPVPEGKPDLTPQRLNTAPSGLTIIGKAMVIRGQIKSREDLHVDGQVDGSLDVTNFRLTIGSNGKVGAGASAREVEVLGTINGDVDASKKITIRKGGRLVGDLRTPGIVIEDGAYFKGKIEIVGTEDSEIANGPSENKTNTAGV